VKNKVFYLFYVIVLINASVSAQIDVDLSFQRPSYHEWDRLLSETSNSEQHIFDWKAGIGVAYRIFPYQVRMGYRPGLHFFYGQKELEFSEAIPLKNYSILQSYLSFPVQIYPFDLWGDCNCPTFGRQHDFFKKAFYLELIPAVSAKQLKFSDQLVNEQRWNVAFHAGLGVGLNFAIKDHLTISPMLSYHLGFAEKWKGLGDFHEETDQYDHTTSSVLQFTLKTSLYSKKR